VRSAAARSAAPQVVGFPSFASFSWESKKTSRAGFNKRESYPPGQAGSAIGASTGEK